MSVGQIRARLEDILRFMQPHWQFVNCHMVSYLTENHWQCFVPPEFQDEVPNSECAQRCIEEVFWTNSEATSTKGNFKGFRQLVASCEEQRLDNCNELITTVDGLNKALGLEEHLEQTLSIKEFMSEKKRHEVEITASLIDRLIQRVLTHFSNEEIFVVDAGDGKGYLSSRLALQYGHKVLGIDFQKLNTENALERNRKLQRAWNGLVKRAEMQQQGLTTILHSKRDNIHEHKSKEADKIEALYKTTVAYITPDLNIVQLLQSQFHSASEKSSICLTGLHTCGNLASTCLRVFHEQPQCKLICNIGCCYHLLHESYAKRDYFENEKISARHAADGFPMSQFLRDKRVALGRNARMLATQSLERVTSARRAMNISLFYRAMLEVLISDSMVEMKQQVQVGKIQKFSSFFEYVELCRKKLPPQEHRLQWSAAVVASMEEKHATAMHYMHLYYLLRMSFAPVVESLILLDRLLYLKELGYEQSYLVSIFDAVKSPRRFGIIAVKNPGS